MRVGGGTVLVTARCEDCQIDGIEIVAEWVGDGYEWLHGFSWEDEKHVTEKHDLSILDVTS